MRGVLSHGGLRKGNPEGEVIIGFYRSPGIADVPLMHWSVEKWRTLHPKPVLMQEGGTIGLTSVMLLTFLRCLGAFFLLFFYLLRERISVAQSRHVLKVLRHETTEICVG